MRRKPRWQSGDVRNIDDCSENGINETFESNDEIFGKLSFSAGQLFGRFGRMHLAPFKLRQYGKNGCSHLTAEIERAIAFWLYVLPRGPFRAVLPHYEE